MDIKAVRAGLQEASEGCERHRLASVRLKELENHLKQVEKEIFSLTCMYEGKVKVLEQLEKISHLTIWYRLTNQYDEKLYDVRKDISKLQEQITAAQQEQTTLQEEIGAAQKVVVEERKHVTRYEKLCREKQDWVEQESDYRHEIARLKQEITAHKAQGRELQEALDVGKSMKRELDGALEKLDKAAGWGTWDILGGGMVSDMAKHANLDDAKRQLEVAKQLEQKLQLELADVKMSIGNITVNTDGFSKVADFLFDGMFADINMQGRIREAQYSVEQAQQEVVEVIRELERLKGGEEAALLAKEKRIGQLVLES